MDYTSVSLRLHAASGGRHKMNCVLRLCSGSFSPSFIRGCGSPPKRGVARPECRIVFVPLNITIVRHLPSLKGHFVFISQSRPTKSDGATLDFPGVLDSFELLSVNRVSRFVESSLLFSSTAQPPLANCEAALQQILAFLS